MYPQCKQLKCDHVFAIATDLMRASPTGLTTTLDMKHEARKQGFWATQLMVSNIVYGFLCEGKLYIHSEVHKPHGVPGMPGIHKLIGMVPALPVNSVTPNIVLLRQVGAVTRALAASQHKLAHQRIGTT